MGATQILPLTVAAPVAGALLILLVRRATKLVEAVTLVTSVVLTGLVLLLLPDALAGHQTAFTLAEPISGLTLRLRIEPLGQLFALLASFLWIVTSVYSIGYMRAHQEQHQARFYASFALALASTMGIAFADNMFTLYVFYEVLTLTTYPLVVHSGTDRARAAGRIYLGVLLSTSIGLLLLAMIWTWNLAGTLDFRSGGILAGTATGPTLGLLYALYLFGIGKAAIMPFHRWLPAAMVAPAPVSALLHAVAVVKAGVFTILKVTVYLFGVDLLAENGVVEWLTYVAAFTILAGSVVALRCENLKERLAYSTVSQLSYIILAALLVNGAGIVGGAMHIVIHAFGKITLFFCAGAIIVATGKTLVSEMAGIGRRMPWTMSAFAVASLSMIGIPPAAGFISKWYILSGALEAGQVLLVVVILLSTLFNAAYFLPIIYTAFFHRSEVPGEDVYNEAPRAILAALGLTAGGTLLLFFLADLPLALAQLIGVGV